MSDENTSPDTPIPATENSAERIAKVIARSGVASRRDAEKMILAGRVTVNGKPVTSPATDVAPTDKVVVDGKPIDAPQETRVWLYYKPLGLVTTEKDDQGRRTIFDEMPEGMPRVLNIGRLDLNSEGLLLLTNDGGLKRRLELPETGWLRKYRVRVNGRPNEATFDPLRRGITIEGEEFQPMEISLDRQQGANAWLTVGLREGKNREIRRAMSEVGLTVNRLIRVSYGPFRLNEMKPGDVMEVKRKLLRDQLGDRLLTGVEGGRAPRAERLAPKERGPRRDEGDARGKKPFEKKPFGKKPFDREDGGRDEKRGFGRQRDFSEGADPAARKPRFGEGKPRFGEGKPRSFGSKSHRDERGEGEEGFRKAPRSFDRPRREDGEKRPFVRREDGDRKPYVRREDGEKKPYGRREEGEKRPYQRREDGDRKPYARREDGDKKPYARREDGEKRPYQRREEGDRKPYARREDGEKKPYARREDGEKKPYSRRDGEDRGFSKPRRDFDGPRERREDGGKPRSYEGKPRSFEGKPRKFDGPREGGEGKRPFPRRDGEDRGFGKRDFTPREGGRDDKFGGKPGPKGPRRFDDDPREGGDKPRFKSAGFKSHGGKPGGKPRAEGFKSHGGKATGAIKRPPRGDKPGSKRD
ncbi:MAG: pseudouridine synthase [Paenirhodobacter sp.]|uniref:pseudouridine synthase n=1 Tax=Paenirhodobacter sp. TaxID=1965326 RepID=UPI003D0DF403